TGAAVLTVTTAGPIKLSQSVTAPSSGEYHLSAYALSTFVSQFLEPGTAGGTLGVDLDGKTAGTQAVASYVGYLEKTIDLSANAGQSITVWYSAPPLPKDYPSAFKGNTWANLDEVWLTKK